MRGVNPIVAILAIVGAVVVAGIVLQVAFQLIGIAILVGVVLIAWYFVQGIMGKRQ